MIFCCGWRRRVIIIIIIVVGMLFFPRLDIWHTAFLITLTVLCIEKCLKKRIGMP